MIQPKISVVTVCYNAVNDIQKTILSVINQTYPNIEYLIIDGGSTDGTMDIVNKYKDKIDVIVSEPDKGIYDAMNKGGKKASGDYVQFLNAGDVLYDNHVFAKLFADGIADDVDVIYGDTIYVMTYGIFYKVPEPIQKFDVTFPIAHPSTFVKRRLFDSLEFDLKFKIAADFKFLKTVFDNQGIFLYKCIPVTVFDSISGVSSKSVYKAWLDFNKVLGVDKYKNWRIRCLLKKNKIWLKDIVYGLFKLLNEPKFRKFCIRKQLQNNSFKLIS